MDAAKARLTLAARCAVPGAPGLCVNGMGCGYGHGWTPAPGDALAFFISQRPSLEIRSRTVPLGTRYLPEKLPILLTMRSSLSPSPYTVTLLSVLLLVNLMESSPS